jgi:sugar lactone lactonase YvrE
MQRKTFAFPAVLALIFLVSTTAANGQVINTVAGGGPNNVAASSASIGFPWGVVQFNGITYISDPFSNRVFKVDASHNLTVLAGDIVANYFFDGSAANTASLNAPEGIAVDKNGNVYIADSKNNVIRVVNTGSSTLTINGVSISAGAIGSVAGNTNGHSCASFSSPPCGDGASALSAFLTAPAGVFLDSLNNIYIADTGDNVVRVVNTQATPITVANVANIQPGFIATIAGNYQPCAPAGPPFCGDTGAGISAQLNLPNGVALDSSGNIYIADTSDFAIRFVNTSTGIISTVAGNFTVCGLPPCGDTGLATAAQLNLPDDVFVDGSLNIFLADTQGQIVREVTHIDGKINTIAGTYTQGFFGDGSSALVAELNTPTGVFVDGTGNIFIADSNNSAIREVTQSDGKINTVIGVGLNLGFSGDGAAKATDAALQNPTGVAADAHSNWYIADTVNNRIRAVNNQAETITIAGVQIAPGSIETIAGDGSPCTNANPTCGDGGPPLQAQISGPGDVVLDAKGNIYIVDTADSVVRVVNTQAATITIAGTPIQPGTIMTVAGDINLGPGYTDNVAATLGQMAFPIGMALDSAGNIYIADGNPGHPGNNVIRVVNAQSTPIKVAGVTIQPGNINTVAGAHGTSCAISTAACGDNGPALNANLNGPSGVAVDRSGNIYIADNSDNRIRVVNTSAAAITLLDSTLTVQPGDIASIAGTGAPCLGPKCGDFGLATAAFLDAPFALSIDYLGNLYIADSLDFVIRAVNVGSKPISLGGISIPAGDIAPVAGTGTPGFHGDGGPAVDADLANPYGLGSDPAGDLLIADHLAWRIRHVATLLATAPTATPAPVSLTFPAQVVNSVSAGKDVTLTNSSNLSPLAISKIATSGDFAETNTCGSSVPPGDCTITVTFKPSAAGTRTGTLTITDSAGTQNVQLSGTGTDFAVASTAANPATVSAGASATSTITITAESGFNSTATLTCSVKPSPSMAPGCSLKPATLTLTGGSAQSTLTITTTAASTALVAPDIDRRSMKFYAVWMLLPAMLLSTAGLAVPNRKKLIAFCLLGLAVAGLLFLVACGGGSSSTGGGGGGSAGTPAGTYTVTVTAKSGSVTQQTQVTMTVQ